MPITRNWQREIDHREARPTQLSRELAIAREQLATIRRMCAACGVETRNLNAVECVRQLAREHTARGAMNDVLHRQQCMYSSEPLPGVQSAFYVADTYVADAETARRARLERAAAAQGERERAAFGDVVVIEQVTQ